MGSFFKRKNVLLPPKTSNITSSHCCRAIASRGAYLMIASYKIKSVYLLAEDYLYSSAADYAEK